MQKLDGSAIGENTPLNEIALSIGRFVQELGRFVNPCAGR
jgi:hypothetical protein